MQEKPTATARSTDIIHNLSHEFVESANVCAFMQELHSGRTVGN